MLREDLAQIGVDTDEIMKRVELHDETRKASQRVGRIPIFWVAA
jgi:hypothetical protein